MNPFKSRLLATMTGRLFAGMMLATAAHAAIITEGTLVVDLRGPDLYANKTSWANQASGSAVGNFNTKSGGNLSVTTLGGYKGLLITNSTTSSGTISNSVISAANVPTTLTKNSTRSVEAWIYPNTATLGSSTPVGWGVAGSYLMSSFRYTGGSSGMFSGYSDDAGWGTSLPAGQWVYVVWTYDGSTVRGYTNGVLANTVALGTALNTATNQVSIGSGRGGTTDPFDGYIADVRVCTGQLTDSDIANNYAQGMYTTASPITSLTWTGATSTDWNNANNWDYPYVPGAGVSVTIPSAPANQPVYSNQMAAASISTVNNSGTLTISTNGFNCGSITMVRAGGGNKLLLTTNAVVNVTGNLGFMSNAVVSLSSGSALSITSTLLVGCGTSGNTTGSTPGSYGVMTNNGGTLTAAITYVGINGSVTANPLLVINGGTNSLGTIYMYRASGGDNSPPSLGTDGLVINNGVVTMGNVNWPGNSHMSIDITGGIVTNNGTFTMNQPTTKRTARFYQSGGLFVNPTANIITNNPGASGAIDIYSVTGGTNVVNGFQFGNSTAGTVNFTVGAPVYIGSGGLSSNGLVTLAATLNNGALFGATADWTNSINMTGSGTVTYQAADLNGTAHNITSSGNLSGSCTLTKTGNGTLTLSGANGYSSSTLINAGTLGLANDGSSTFGSLASPTINVAAGATFDVSQVAAGYVLGSTKTIAGSGTVAGAFAAGTSANITPGGSGAQGTLTFANGLSTTNAAYNMELTSDPTGTTLTNDAVSITGDLTVSGVNNIVVTPVGSLGLGTYKLITFTGNLNGDASNFACSAGTIVTNTGEIDLVVTSVRPLANLIWRGDGSANLWDIGASSNWLNGVSLDRFYTGDTNTFDDSATNFTVNLVGTLSPAPLSAVLVNATNDYLFTGNGDLHGTTGLTKTNSGRLVILSTNDYSGVTTVSGGTLSVANLANGGSACAIGAAAGGSGDLVIGNGVFEYTGNNVSINRGATLTSTNSTLAVTNSVKSLTLSGTITGSGTLNKVGPGTLILSSANSYGATTVSNGTLQINNTTAVIGSGLLTLAGGRLDLYSGGSQPTVANNINVTANSSLYVHGNNTVFSGSWTGNQTINVTVDSGGYFTLDHDISSFAGIISMGTSAGNFRLNAGGNGSGAQQCTGSASAAFDLGTGSVVLYNRNGGTNTYGIYNLGRLSGGSSTQLKGASNGGGAINASYYSIGARNEDSEFDGTIVDGGGGSGATTAIIKVGTGTLTLSGVNTYTGTTVVSNGTLQVNGSLSGSSVVTVAGGKLGGIGTIGGATTLNSGATLEAGIGDIGTLTFSGNLNLNAASTNAFVVTTDGGTSNSVAVQGQLSPNGSVVKVTSGSPLAIGTYPLFTYSTVSGSFNAVPVFDVAPAANASIQDNGSGQINLVISTGPSGPASITNSISGSTLTLGWPAGQNWRLEGQTNNLSTGLSPTGWGTVSGAGVSDGNATITIDPNQPSVFYRLVYP